MTGKVDPWWPAVANDACLLTRRGKDYEEIYCVYPWMRHFYMDWEFTWRPEFLFDWMHRNNWFPVACCVVYMIAIYLGPKYMENREPYVMKRTLAAWNLLLSIFSWIGVARLLPALIHNVSTYGWENYLCMDPENSIGPSATGMWCLFFVLSKPAELVDTFFIVAHKKKLMLLHWYHHVTVLLCTWYTFITHCPPGLVYSTINFGVHAVMYFYYFLMAIKCKPKWFNPKWITIAQITQMVVGSVVSTAAFLVVRKEGCWASWENNTGILVMYVSYFFLFLQFFLQRYGLGINVNKGGAKSSEKKTKTT
ncbi:of very long chain fatty acids protein 6 [Seminavis robusta]|uniref:Elongation of fatty acids protein n=1 Tax=Seminavis robusta TaxID=568900 RepID=A0A9N8EAP1_9STRA|nr:of very long chain fatty acids protein 6 [Seminavis robusta]|eukprot:Sro892_g216930.1 of very long chain fatty acids protein 6 (308) ;mRNA; f:14430-15599